MKTSKITRIISTSVAAGGILSAHAAVTILTDPGDIAAFKLGATVETFDDLSALPISAYTPKTDTTFSFSTRDVSTSPTFDSGGATAKNPASNPGMPVGVLKPENGILGDVSSSPNVIGPVTNPNFDPNGTLSALDPLGFMEVAFPLGKDAAKVGFYITHGSVNVQVQGDDLSQLDSDALLAVPAGSFVAFTRNSADIRNVSLTPANGVFTIDDFTYAFQASTPPPTTTTPDGGATLGLALSLLAIGFAQCKVRARNV